MGEIIGAVNGTWPNEFQAYILSKRLQLRIVIIQDHYEKGFYPVYDTDCSFVTEELFKKDVEVANSTGNSTSSSLCKAPTGNKTCYLLRFDPTTPQGMCHWTQYDFIHFIYLQDVTGENQLRIKREHTKVEEELKILDGIHSKLTLGAICWRKVC